MKIANCLIIKEENKYLREWVEYYKAIGYDSILLYDNNDPEGEHPQDVVGDYMETGFVVYHNVRGEIRPQKRVYNECLLSHKLEYDWTSFFDADEFLNTCDIKDYLSLDVFDKFDEILIHWTMVNDGDEISSSKELLKRNVKVIHPTYPSSKAPMDWTVKTILRTKTDAKFISSIHHATGNIRTCNSYGRPVFSCLYEAPSNTLVSLIHFRTKTISEYMKRISVGDVNLKHGSVLIYNKIESFFASNTITDDKLKIVKSYFPDWSPFTIKDKRIDVVVLRSRKKQTIENNIRQYIPFIGKIWFVNTFEELKNLDIAERVIVIYPNVVFKHHCLECDFFIENQSAKCDYDYIVPLFKMYFKDTLHESIALHNEIGCRKDVLFYIGEDDMSNRKAYIK